MCAGSILLVLEVMYLQDVLDPLVDGVLPLQETKEVLRDVLWVLGSKASSSGASTVYMHVSE